MTVLGRAVVVLEEGAVDHPALERAFLVARRCATRLTLVLWDFDPSLEGGFGFEQSQLDELRQLRRRERLEHLDAHAAPLRDSGIDVTLRYAWGHPSWEPILEAIRHEAPDLVFAPVHFHPRLARLLLRNQDWELVRRCPVPLWLTGNRVWHEAPTVLVAVDPVGEHDKPVALDERLLEIGRELGARLDMRLQVGHVADVDALGARFRRELETQHEEALNGLVRAHALPSACVHRREGAVAPGLAALAEEVNADLLVTGAVKRGRLQRMIVGNTAEQVLDLVGCDVLVAKPPPEAPPGSAEAGETAARERSRG